MKMMRTFKNTQLPIESWIGFFSSFSEAYNMAIFPFLAPFLGLLLFPNESRLDAVLFSYCFILIGASISYAFGAFYYGYRGDYYGRQSACISSTLGLAVTTGLLGLVPIDFSPKLAIVLYLFLNSCQYFFSGGEYYLSIIFSLEHGKKKPKGFLSGLSCLFAVGGLMLAQGLSLLSQQTSFNFPWRLCFFLGFLSSLVSFFLKKYCKESPEFQVRNFSSFSSRHFKDFLTKNFFLIVRFVIVFGFFSTIYNFIFLVLPFLSKGDHVQTLDTFICLGIYGGCLLLSGCIADRLGINKTLYIGVFSCGLLIFPLLLFNQGHIFFVQVVLTICACLFIGPLHGWALDQFQGHERCQGILISSAIAVAFFSNSAVPISLAFFRIIGSEWAIGIYPTIISIITVITLRKYSRKEKFLI